MRALGQTDDWGYPYDQPLYMTSGTIESFVSFPKGGFLEIIPWQSSNTFPGSGVNFDRPTHYMAACLALDHWDAACVDRFLDDLKRWKQEQDAESQEDKHRS